MEVSPRSDGQLMKSGRPPRRRRRSHGRASTMDAHYDQVMKARESAGQGTKKYFAYSTTLDRAAFEEWRGQHSYDFFDLPKGVVAEAVDIGLVYDFPSRWWGGRVAGLKDAPGQ